MERLNDYMYHMTKDALIYGYEVAACEDQTCAEKLANAFDRRDVETMKSVEHIEGVAQLMKDMSLHMNYDVELVDSRHMVCRWQEKLRDGICRHAEDMML